MPITLEVVEKMARLAKLRFDDAEKARLAQQLDQIVAHVEKINELDTEGIEPSAHPVAVPPVLRQDAVQPGLTREEALANAPARHAGYFSVPKVIHGG